MSKASPGPGCAEAMMVEDQRSAPAGVHSAMVVDLARQAGEHLRIGIAGTIDCGPEGAAVIPSDARVWIAMGQPICGRGCRDWRCWSSKASGAIPTAATCSTLADQVGAASFALMPLYRRIESHVLAAERLHGDDTTVPVMARGKTDTARLWVRVPDDRPFVGADPPAALFHYSRNRHGQHPHTHLASWAGILQADAYGGYG